MTNEELKAKTSDLEYCEEYPYCEHLICEQIDRQKALETLRTQLTTLQQENIALMARLNILMPLRAKHFPAECLTCRDGDPCEHKRLMDLSVTPMPTTLSSKVMELVRAALKYHEICQSTPSDFYEAADAFTEDEIRWIGGK